MTDLAIQPNQLAFKLFTLPSGNQDILASLLSDKRSPNTRRAYERNLKAFFQHITQHDPTTESVHRFLSLTHGEAVQIVLTYKAALIAQGLAEATVNQYIAAIKSLVEFAQLRGQCGFSLAVIKGEKVQSYRDTSGVGLDEFKTLFKAIDRSTLKGKRDYAILRLLWDNVLRRNEIVSTSIKDFDPAGRTLTILGKGRGSQKETITLSAAAVEGLKTWLEVYATVAELSESSPLFISVDRAHFGKRLTGDGLYHLVRFQLAEKADFKKVFSPHRCRHSGITASLNANNGNIRETQKLSRHARPDTVMKYDDNRVNAQGKLTDALADLMNLDES